MRECEEKHKYGIWQEGAKTYARVRFYFYAGTTRMLISTAKGE